MYTQFVGGGDASGQTTGMIDNVGNSGTIVVVFLRADDDGVVPVYFDHRSFRWLLEAEQCTPEELVGRPAAFDGEIIHFMD
jgi:hypothetical protein